MAVVVACPCGKQVKVSDELVGKKIRCPACKEVVLVRPARAAAAPSAAPEVVRLRCEECGKELKARAEYAGRQLLCPGCKAPMTVPGAAVTAARPAASARNGPPSSHADRRGAPHDLPDEDEEDERPTKRRRRLKTSKRPVWPWVVAAAAGVLLLSGGGWATWYFGFRKSPTTTVASTPTTPAADPEKKDDRGRKDDDRETPPELRVVPPTAQGFATLRVADVWRSDDANTILETVQQDIGMDVRALVKAQEDAFGVSLNDVERVTAVVGDVRNNPPAIWAIVSTSKPYDRNKLLTQFAKLGLGLKEITSGKHTYHTCPDVGPDFALYFPTDRMLIAGSKSGVEAYLQHADSPNTDGPLKNALKQADVKRHLVVGGVIPPLVLNQMRQSLPPQARRFGPLLDLNTVVLGLDVVGATQRAELTMFYAGNANAARAKSAADDLKSFIMAQLPIAKQEMARLGAPPEARAMYDNAEKALGSAKVEQKNEAVTIGIVSEGTAAERKAMLKSTVGTALRQVLGEMQPPPPPQASPPGSENLKQLGLALLAYHAKFGHYPPEASYDLQGKALLSWRVHLLPFLGEDTLYKEFHLNERWDSDHNKKLLSRMPAVFRTPNYQLDDQYITYYQVFVSERQQPPAQQAPFLKGRGTGQHNGQTRQMTEIRDGTSNTIAIAQAANAVSWTSPEDITFRTGTTGLTTGSLGLPGVPSFSLVFFDGTVRTYPKTIDQKKLQALVTPSGGEPVSP